MSLFLKKYFFNSENRRFNFLIELVGRLFQHNAKHNLKNERMLNRKCENFAESDSTQHFQVQTRKFCQINAKLKKHSFLKFKLVFKQEIVINLLKQDVRKGFTAFKP